MYSHRHFASPRSNVAAHLSRLILLALLLPLAGRAQSPNVANVPATDPAPVNPPSLVAAMQGTHPRLLFTAPEIDALKQQINSDPVLKKASDDVIAWAKTFKCPTGTPDIVSGGDTPAIWKGLGLYPSLAYAYALTHDPEIKQKIIDVLTMMLNQPYWSPDNAEADNSMGAACNMAMVGILYDAVYNDLDPDFRAKMTAKILLHCRRMYYLGHKEMGLAVKYWQQDPQPNHRWYRDAGLAACLLAIADEKDVDTRYLLEGLKSEMDLVMKWYPPDGDCHEGTSYQQFGYLPIVIAVEMMDRVMGTDYLKSSGLKNAASQQLYYWVPGRSSDISYGDDQNGVSASFGNDDGAFFAGPHLTRDKNMQAALARRMVSMERPSKWGPYTFPWSMLAFYDPTVGEGDYTALPTYKLFSDMGAASMRDSWENDAVVFTFKCGPYGGYRLNAYRQENLDAQGRPHGINIAHDDPDANEFALSIGNGFVFHPGVYSFVAKLTKQHSTLTVDDKGQIGEGFNFTQPVGNLDMRTFSYLTGWKVGDGGRIIIEGEAGNAYRGVTGPELKKLSSGTVPDPVLKKFRRTAIWMPGEYILILDDIAAAGSHQITWHGSVPTGQASSNGHNTATTETGQQVGFQILSNHDLTNSIDDKMVLDGRWGNVSIQQFQFSLNTDAVKFACLIDPWKKQPEMKMSEANGVVTLSIHSPTFDDTWTWHEAKDGTTPSEIQGSRSGAALISLNAEDKAPTP